MSDEEWEDEERQEAAVNMRRQLASQEADHADAFELVRSAQMARVSKIQVAEVSQYLDELQNDMFGSRAPEPEPDMWGDHAAPSMYTEFERTALEERSARQLPPSISPPNALDWDEDGVGVSYVAPPQSYTVEVGYAAPPSPVAAEYSSTAAPQIGLPMQADSVAAAMERQQQAEEDEWIRGFGDHPDADEAVEWDNAQWVEDEGQVMVRAGDCWEEVDDMEQQQLAAPTASSEPPSRCEQCHVMQTPDRAPHR
jgi:hypothetical protein